MIILIKILVIILSRLEEDRVHVDYDPPIPITKEKAETDLYNAKLFIEECRRFL